ncbi:hypothetical protein BC629DRAFT_1249534, partial [Irpex lacteus]
WLEELAQLSAVEQNELHESAQPICLVPVKISKVSFSIIHSSTILLPSWKRALKELKLNKCQLPRDVQTRCDSTYHMLSVA